jgi:YVTN family beta-propeller protein
MRATSRKIIRGTLWGVTAIVLIACAVLLRLVWISEPGKAASVQFQGFVLLPKGALLTVLDYLTVSGQLLFVTDESTGSVYKVALHERTLPHSSDVSVFSAEPAAHGVVVDPQRRLAYVTRSEVDAVDVFDPSTMKPVARIAVAEDPDAILFDSLHGLIYVANGGAHQATLIDPATRRVISIIALGGKPEFAAVDAQTKLIYQNLRDIHAVAAVDVTARSVVQRWNLPGCTEPAGMAIDEVGRKLFIGCAGNAVLTIFDLNAHRVSASVPVGGGPDAVAFDPELHRIYTAGKAGVLTVIRQRTPEAYEVLDSMKLHYGAHTLAFDPSTHNLFVAYASLLVRPRVAVFAPLGDR